MVLSHFNVLVFKYREYFLGRGGPLMDPSKRHPQSSIYQLQHSGIIYDIKHVARNMSSKISSDAKCSFSRQLLQSAAALDADSRI